MALAAERAGFDAFFRSDHYLGTDPTNPDFRPTDAWTTLGGLARDTTRIRLGTLMTASTFRHPGPLAVAVASVDQMSAGRIELGIGAAWYEREHRSLGIPFAPLKERFDRLGEQLAIITGLWRGEPGTPFSFEGEHWSATACAAFPRLVQRPHPPIVIGGGGPRRTPLLAARFAAEYNSGFTDGIAERFANVRRICEEVGRDPATLGLSTTVPVCCGATRAEAERRAEGLGEGMRRLLSRGVVGTPDDVLAHLEQLASFGVDTAYFHCYDADDPDQVTLLGTELVDKTADLGPGAPGRGGPGHHA